MPTYEYVCDQGHEAEQRQSIKDDPLERCPEEGCDAPANRKISMGGGVISGTDGGRDSGRSGSDACSPSGFT